MTTNRPAMLENSAIIVCHPDDEVLWFGSILDRVDTVITAYEDYFAQPRLGAARAAVLRDFPRQIESLRLPEAGSYGLADWSNPRLSPHGIAFRPAARSTRELKRRALAAIGNVVPAMAPAADRCASDRYAANHDALMDALRPRLSRGMNVFTHNPWGEYGHEDHIQMHQVLNRLRGEIGFTLWMSNYCTERSFTLAKTYFARKPGRPVRMPVNAAYCEAVAAIYKRHGCWTWADDWSWFSDEYFLEAPTGPSGDGAQRHLFPLNMFTIDADAPERWMMQAAGLTAAAAGLGVAAVMAELV